MSLLDTSVIIEMLRRKKFEIGSISILTLIEILRGIKAEKRRRVKELLEKSFNIIPLDNEVIEVYCTLYRKLREDGKILPDVDLLIAATAISRDLLLKTRDEHFMRLKNYGLKLSHEIV